MLNEYQRGGIQPLVDAQGYNPKEIFPEFYNNDTIKELAKNPKWSISNNDKVPINMFKLRFEGDPTRGASPFDPTSMVTLEEILQLLPTAANYAYYLDYTVDDIIVLDIEKTCPDDLKEKFLKVPYLYGEVSLSGEGYHLIVPTPYKLFKQNPASLNCVKMQDKQRRFEVLMNHWVTFTRNALPPSEGTQDLAELINELVLEQQETQKGDVSVEAEMPKGQVYDDFVDRVCNTFRYRKDLSDFNNDYSRFEFGYLSKLAITIRNMLKHSRHNFSDNEVIWIMGRVAEIQLRHRDKHDTYRNGLPWLVYNAQEAYAASMNDSKKG